MTTQKTKTLECSQVLKLMDEDYEYQEALQIILYITNREKKELEEELNNYI